MSGQPHPYPTAMPKFYCGLAFIQVRLGLIDPGDLHNVVMQNVYIKESTECAAIINEALAASMDLKCRHPLSRPRLPISILVVTGGKNGPVAETSLEAYDCRADCWVTLMTERIQRAHHDAAVLNNSMYIIGGCNSQVYFNTVFKFDLATNTWQQVASMNFHRCYVSIAVHNGCIYAFGGYNGHTYYNNTECYKPETDQWTMMAPMQTRRCDPSATILNGKVGEELTETSNN